MRSGPVDAVDPDLLGHQLRPGRADDAVLAQHQADLARQLDGVVVDRHQQPVRQQPAHRGVQLLGPGRPPGVPDLAVRRPGGQLVEHGASTWCGALEQRLDLAPAGQQLQRLVRVADSKVLLQHPEPDLVALGEERRQRSADAVLVVRTSRTLPTTCTARSSPHTSARSLRLSSGRSPPPARRRRSPRARDGGFSCATSASRTLSRKASRLSSARRTDSRTAARAASTPRSGGTGTARSGRACSNRARRVVRPGAQGVGEAPWRAQRCVAGHPIHGSRVLRAVGRVW